MLNLIHENHLGIVKSKQLARESLYWPGMSHEIEEKVSDCTICHDHSQAQAKEPLIPSTPPDIPWSKVGTDIFSYNGQNYVLLIDYYSKFIEVDKMNNLTAHDTIEALKENFCRHGIPEKVVSECGTQYTSAEFQEFAALYCFKHILISLKHSQANGEAEAAVKIVKSLWKKNTDKQKALLAYRATPLQSIGLSPSQLCMSRRLRTQLPISRKLLQPEAFNGSDVKHRMHLVKERQKTNFDKHGTKELPPHKQGDTVRIRPDKGDIWKPATVVKHHDNPRSYVVDTGSKRLRRNRVALRRDTEQSNQDARKRSERDERTPLQDKVQPVETYLHAIQQQLTMERPTQLALTLLPVLHSEITQ